MSIDIVKSKSSAGALPFVAHTKKDGIPVPILVDCSEDTPQNEKVYLQRVGRTLRPKNKGCNSCKHHESKLSNWHAGKFEMIYTCLVGNTDACNTWWQNNGKLSSNDKTEDMPCFENTEINEMLQGAIDKADEILLRLKINLKTNE